jgi:hydroxypyruvate isomerase
MIAYAPNISFLLQEIPIGARFKAVRDAGFEAVEVGFFSEADLLSVAKYRKEYEIRIALLNQYVPDWDTGHRGYLADNRLKEDFQRSYEKTLTFARDLEAIKVMLPLGVTLEGVEREVQIEWVINNLRIAAPMAADAGVLLTIEAMNPYDCPGYFLTSSQEGFEIVKQVDHPNLRFQFDTYHLQMMEGNIATTLAENMALIGHIQFGDYPGRSEPGHGVIDFIQIDSIADSHGYNGYIGLEYKPSSPGARTLDWVPPHRRRLDYYTQDHLSFQPVSGIQ